jgi:hypothetical protein
MPTPARSFVVVLTAAITLTIEELRPNISSKSSDSWKNPISPKLRDQIDACVLFRRTACHIRHATVDDEPPVRLTTTASREHHRFEAEIADGKGVGPATGQSRPTTTNYRSR